MSLINYAFDKYSYIIVFFSVIIGKIYLYNKINTYIIGIFLFYYPIL